MRVSPLREVNRLTSGTGNVSCTSKSYVNTQSSELARLFYEYLTGATDKVPTLESIGLDIYNKSKNNSIYSSIYQGLEIENLFAYMISFKYQDVIDGKELKLVMHFDIDNVYKDNSSITMYQVYQKYEKEIDLSNVSKFGFKSSKLNHIHKKFKKLPNLLFEISKEKHLEKNNENKTK